MHVYLFFSFRLLASRVSQTGIGKQLNKRLVVGKPRHATSSWHASRLVLRRFLVTHLFTAIIKSCIYVKSSSLQRSIPHDILPRFSGIFASSLLHVWVAKNFDVCICEDREGCKNKRSREHKENTYNNNKI